MIQGENGRSQDGSGHMMMATSGKEKDLRFIIPHSMNGRCMSLGQVSMVGGAEQSHVEWEWVGSGEGHGDHAVIILGLFSGLRGRILILKKAHQLSSTSDIRVLMLLPPICSTSPTFSTPLQP